MGSLFWRGPFWVAVHSASCLCLFLLIFLPSRQVRAADVETCAPQEPGELLRESLVRVRAELRAAGFSVAPELCRNDNVELGGIEFSMTEAGLEIRSTSVASGGTMIQMVDLNQRVITAEVIAVRAVESLRAVLLQSLRSGEIEEERISPRLRKFTQFGIVAERATRGEVRKSVAEVPEVPSSTRRRSLSELRGLLSLGPSVEFFPQVKAFAIGAEARGMLVLRGASLGLIAQVEPFSARADLGHAEVSMTSWSVLFRPGVNVPCGPVWECHLGLAAGIHSSRFRMLVDRDNEAHVVHRTWTVQGDALLGHYWSSGWGGTIQLRGGALIDAPILRSSAEQAELRWGRPLLAGTLALSYRL